VEPALEIRMVWENLALAMALWIGARKGLIKKDDLPTGKTVVPSGPGTLERVYNPLELRSEQELARCISNQLRGGVTFSAMLTQRTLDLVLGPSPLQETDPDLRAARCAIYLLSSALSQGMLSPVWHCKGPFRDRFEVKTISLVLDASVLDGKPVFWEDIGGLEKYLELLAYLADQMEQLGSGPRQWSEIPQEEIEEEILIPGSTSDLCQPKVAESQLPNGSGSEATASQVMTAGTGEEPLAGFLETRCNLVPESYTIAAELYSNYLGWCEDAGQNPLAQRSFGIQLTKLGFVRKRRGRGRHWWKGLEAIRSSV
jgi:hypothetical protein